LEEVINASSPLLSWSSCSSSCLCWRSSSAPYVASPRVGWSSPYRLQDVMLCIKPFMSGAVPFGCGQCLPCRINKRRQWAARQFFESLSHEENTFITLTYSDEHLPAGNNLVPRDLQLFLKRLRKQLHPLPVRFFAVGEYGHEGTRQWNPHYHLSLFGAAGRTDLNSRGVPTHWGISEKVWTAWGKGIATCYEFNEKTASYVSGYTVKKLTSAGDAKLSGRHPEFMRSSRRPGLGTQAMSVIAETLLASGHFKDDVPNRLKVGSKDIPLGRFLLAKLRKFAGMTDEQIKLVKDKVSMERSLEMLALFQDSLGTEEVPTFRKTHIEEVQQRVINAEARYKIWSAKKGKI
ncbi:replication initiator protein, partial [Apis mellifera associated microvirus 45]